MKIPKARRWIAATIALLIVGVALYAVREPRAAESRQSAGLAGALAQTIAPSKGARVQSSAADASPVAAKRAAIGREMLDWQRGLYDPQTTATTLAQAVDAAEAGDLTALHEIRDLLIMCKDVMEYVRAGGDRERWVSEQLVPANGIRWFESHYDRCAAIATAKPFATWSLSQGRLTTAYWDRLAAQFDDPLLRSFAIAEDVDAYDHADRGQRAGIRARVEDDVHRVLRSADPAAWSDLGLRLMDPRLVADKAVGLALIEVGCERGYDCTKNNVHNLVLRCDGSFDPNCGSAVSLREWLGQREGAATNARAHSLYERLTLLLNQGDWEGIEKLIPLDGTALR